MLSAVPTEAAPIDINPCQLPEHINRRGAFPHSLSMILHIIEMRNALPSLIKSIKNSITAIIERPAPAYCV
jgi:hypothetical protein